MDQIQNAKILQSEISELLSQDKLVETTGKFAELDRMFQATKALYQEISLIKQSAQCQIIERLKKIRCDVEILENPNATLEDIQRLQHKDSDVRELAPGISVSTVAVPNEDFVPDTPLYYLRSTGEFAVKISGSVIRGKIGDIDPSGRVAMCNHADACTKSKCSWNHQVGDVWSPGNFLYTREPLQKKNLHMRHIGSRTDLKIEIQAATRAEREMRARQTAHDLLIQLCIVKIEAGH